MVVRLQLPDGGEYQTEHGMKFFGYWLRASHGGALRQYLGSLGGFWSWFRVGMDDSRIAQDDFGELQPTKCSDFDNSMW